MKKRVSKFSICCLVSGVMLVGAGAMTAGAAEAGQAEEAQIAAADTADAQAATADEAAWAEETAQNGEAAETVETDLTGQMAFAQCEEYINIRSGASTDSEVVAKIYNNGSVTILEQTGDWYKIQSGNAEGYVKAEYFATGEAAEVIAQEAAYNVAVVHPDELNVRTQPSVDTDVIDVAHHQDELEVVAYDGDWMKVALGGDVYGYVNAYYVDYKTYYPQAVTLEEERARLEAEQAAAEAATYEGPSETYEEPQESYEEPSETYEEPSWEENEAGWEETYTEPEYTETEAPYTEPEYTETEAPYTEPEYTETETPQTEPQYTETEAPQTEPEYTETEAPYTEPEYAEPEYTETEAPTSSTGSDIANYALQFVGNPYVWGGTSLTSGADCSGFVQSVFANFGIGLARTAADQSYGGTDVSLDNLQAGDLLFYNSTGSIDHVAIYIGGGSIVHAANSSSGICTSSYNYSTPVCARRYW